MRKGGWTSRLLAVVALASMCAVVDAAEPREFNIPGGELKAALDAYMQQSGAQLIYWTEDVRGIRTQPVVGTMTPEDALQQLLQNTPFVIKRNASGAMALVARNMAHGSGAAEATDTPAAAPNVLEGQREVCHGRSGGVVEKNPAARSRGLEFGVKLRRSVETRFSRVK